MSLDIVGEGGGNIHSMVFKEQAEISALLIFVAVTKAQIQ